LLTIRWCILGLSHSLWVVFATQLLHSYTFLLVAFCMAKYINDTVPGSHKASAQMFYTVVLSSGMKIIANFTAGQIAQVFGTAQSFLAAAALTALPLIGLLIYLARKRRAQSVQMKESE
jgi:PPP family 3-phenylpropionic acid transporter